MPVPESSPAPAEIEHLTDHQSRAIADDADLAVQVHVMQPVLVGLTLERILMDGSSKRRHPS